MRDLSLQFSEGKQLPTFHTEPVFPVVKQSQGSPNNSDNGPEYTRALDIPVLTHSFLRDQQKFGVRIITRTSAGHRPGRSHGCHGKQAEPNE